MSEHPRIRWWPAVLVAAAVSTPALADDYRSWPVQPRLDVRYLSVNGTPYLADSPGLKQALAKSGGDAEAGTVTLHVSRFDESFEHYYKGSAIGMTSRFYWNLRSGQISYARTHTSVDEYGRATKSTSTEPFAPIPEHLEYECVLAPGQWTTRTKASARCTLVHTVSRFSRIPGTHTLDPVRVDLVLNAQPLPTDCSPVTRGSRVLAKTFQVPRTGTLEFDLTTTGLRNEQVYPDGGWTLAFNPTKAHDR